MREEPAVYIRKPNLIYYAKHKKNIFLILINNFQMSGESMDTSEKTYGGCEGPDAMYVKLISSDGRKFK